MNVLLTLLAQLFFSLSDMLKRMSSAGKAFSLDLLKDPLYLLGVVVLPTVGYVVLLYVFTRFELSRAVPTLAAAAVVFAMVLGPLVLKESVNGWNIFGAVLAVAAIVLIQVK